MSLLTLVVAAFFVTNFTRNLPSAYAIGCDSYGYLKQKQRISSEGYLAGLHTAETGAEANLLIAIASKINGNPLTWSEMIAPHCHHFDKTTQQIVLQYPPGTGLALSVLPEDKELQALSAFMVVSLVLLYCLGNYRALDFRYFLLSTFCTYVVLATAVRFQVASYSIPVTLALIPWAVILLGMLRPGTNARNIAVAIALGAICGLLVDVRIASLLIMPGVAAIVATKSLAGQPYRRPRAWLVPAVWLGCLGLATMPLLYANRVNVGGMFNSTYAVYDRELRFNNFGLLADNINYYFTGNLAGAVAVLALAFISLRLIGGANPPAGPGRISLVILLLTLLGNLLFFILKPVAIDYYFLPVSVFCLCFSLLDYSGVFQSESETRQSAPRTYLILMTLLMLTSGLLYLVKSVTPGKVVVEAPQAIFDARSIVYAGESGGTINYYLGKYTSKLDFATYCMAEQLLTRVALSGKKQYVVNDTPKMDALIHDLGMDQFNKIGVAGDSASQYGVYEFNAERAKSIPLISCDLAVTRQLASQIDLRLSGEVSGNTFRGIVTLTNNSGQSFSTRPVAGPVKLSWRFVDTKSTKNPPPWIARKNLTMMIASEHTYEIPFATKLPEEKGEYLLEVTLVQEGFSWFHDFGMPVPSLPVMVD